MPGFVEIDLVGHEGGNSSGEFCFTLTLTVTDIATGWTVNRSVRNKAQRWVFEALTYIIARFPFPILGIDSDNGSEFINGQLLRFCIERKITFTRSRPGNKNDGAHVEQKNWARVRELVGYYRYDTPAELAKLNEIWELDAVFTNYLLPQQKLIFKQRHGAKVTKKHDTATTPHQRAVAHPGMRTADHHHERRLQEDQTRRTLSTDPGPDRTAGTARPGQGRTSRQATGQSRLERSRLAEEVK